MKIALATTLFVVFLLRTPRALSNPRGRPSWLASGLGGAGLLIADSYVPYATVDAWFGGTNSVHLVRNLLLTSALWFLHAAVAQVVPRIRISPGSWKLNPWVLVGGLTAISVPFFIADTEGTSSSFVTDHGSQLAIYLYSSIYMAFVALMCLDLVWLLRGSWKDFLGLIRIGALVAAIACIDEIVYVTALWTNTGSDAFRAITLVAFNTIYLGVALMILSLSVMALGRTHPLQKATTRALEGLVNHHSVSATDFSRIHTTDLAEAGTDRSRMYRAYITFRDLEAQPGVKAGLYARLVLHIAQLQLTRRQAPINAQ